MGFLHLLNTLQSLVTLYGLRLLGAAALVFAGRWAARAVRRVVRRLLDRASVEPTLVQFAGNFAHWALFAFALIAAMGVLGIQTTSLVAVLGAAGLAVGLALQGSLANVAGGVLLLFLRPFKLGDFVEAAGVMGTVKDIDIFTCTFITPDNKRVTIPNASITGGNVVNYTATGTRRLDLAVGVAYHEDLARVRAVIAEVVRTHPMVLSEPAPVIGVMELADSCITIAVRPWVNTADYWNAHFSLTEAIKTRFDADGITIPFPQRDVHLIPAATPASPSA